MGQNLVDDREDLEVLSFLDLYLGKTTADPINHATVLLYLLRCLLALLLCSFPNVTPFRSNLHSK